MRKGKLKLSLLMFFVAVALVLSGCGTSSNSPNKSKQDSESIDATSDETGGSNNTGEDNDSVIGDDSSTEENSGVDGPSPSEDSSSDTLNVSLTPPSELLDEPAEIAAALSKPESAELGVWSLLKELGIGVYTGEGIQVMNGSERDSDDFWLYDFYIPILADKALKSTHPFSEYHAKMARVGLPISTSEFLSLYRDMYNAPENEDAFLVRLFNEWKISFNTDFRNA